MAFKVSLPTTSEKRKGDPRWLFKVCIQSRGPDTYRQTKKGTFEPVGIISNITYDKCYESSINGRGTFSTVCWHPNITEYRSGGKIEHKPSFITLGHELIHAYHNLCGTRKPKYYDEEDATIGVRQYVKSEGVTENKLREEHGIVPREGKPK
ncbi:MAG: hypothetical protein GY737_19445 [Desulfobacteraceae bacterium]|nr:hypothetical protein [Desulfobacteraceae bacterium]